MTLPGPSIQLTAAVMSGQLVLPNGDWRAMVVYNQSPFVLTLGYSGNVFTLPPWWADQINPLPSAGQPVTLTAAIPGASTIPPGTADVVTTVLYGPDDPPPRGYPVSLSAQAIVAAIGGSVSIVGNVSVVPGTGSPTWAPALAPAAPAGALAMTGAADQFPAHTLVQGAILRALDTNTAAVYIGPNSVTVGGGLELAKTDPPVFIPVANLDDLWAIGAPADVVTWLAV